MGMLALTDCSIKGLCRFLCQGRSWYLTSQRPEVPGLWCQFVVFVEIAFWHFVFCHML